MRVSRLKHHRRRLARQRMLRFWIDQATREFYRHLAAEHPGVAYPTGEPIQIVETVHIRLVTSVTPSP